MGGRDQHSLQVRTKVSGDTVGKNVWVKLQGVTINVGSKRKDEFAQFAKKMGELKAYTKSMMGGLYH